jgi:capsular polysaccharide biosynthesis protein
MSEANRVPWARWILVAGLLIVIGAAVAASFTATAPLQYESSLTYILDGASGPDDTESAGRTVESLLTGEPLANDIIQATGVPLTTKQFLDNLDVARPPAAAVIDVVYADSDPEQAQEVILALNLAFQARMAKLSKTSEKTSERYSVTPWSQAQTQSKAVGRPITINSAIGAMIGAMIAVALLGILWGRQGRIQRSGQDHLESGD